MAKTKKKITRKLSVFIKTTGEIPVRDFLLSLKARNEASSRLSFSKFPVYMRILLEVGPILAGTNYVRKIEGIQEDIWELRPGDARVFFVALVNEVADSDETVENYVLLHGFVKSTKKTPPSEIKRAQNELKLLACGHADQTSVDVDEILNLRAENNSNSNGGDDGQ